ncbi:hypothetical protein CMV_017003 [Castanea mollissima]|uniref:Uncharacterized protein n=1 Tax=Castanea mollissima TaxID=60419 RepID=A0A8J4VHL6_9ROSI|nr:hypothetical protein CMV_017003 [Castanea mollissima]
MVLSTPETQTAAATKLISQLEVEFVICDCCGLTEECTPAYIAHVRELYYGKWICGLCGEAIKDEIIRSYSAFDCSHETDSKAQFGFAEGDEVYAE